MPEILSITANLSTSESNLRRMRFLEKIIPGRKFFAATMLAIAGITGEVNATESKVLSSSIGQIVGGDPTTRIWDGEFSENKVVQTEAPEGFIQWLNFRSFLRTALIVLTTEILLEVIKRKKRIDEE